MVVMVLENVPVSLRGELSRWFMEVKAGVFLGHVSATVRDALWDRCVDGMRVGGVMQVFTYPTEQGFLVRRAGNLSRELVDHEGLYLIRKPLRGKGTSDEDAPPF